MRTINSLTKDQLEYVMTNLIICFPDEQSCNDFVADCEGSTRTLYYTLFSAYYNGGFIKNVDPNFSNQFWAMVFDPIVSYRSEFKARKSTFGNRYKNAVRFIGIGELKQSEDYAEVEKRAISCLIMDHDLYGAYAIPVGGLYDWDSSKPINSMEIQNEVIEVIKHAAESDYKTCETVVADIMKVGSACSMAIDKERCFFPVKLLIDEAWESFNEEELFLRSKYDEFGANLPEEEE